VDIAEDAASLVSSRRTKMKAPRETRKIKAEEEEEEEEEEESTRQPRRNGTRQSPKSSQKRSTIVGKKKKGKTRSKRKADEVISDEDSGEKAQLNKGNDRSEEPHTDEGKKRSTRGRRVTEPVAKKMHGIAKRTKETTKLRLRRVGSKGQPVASVEQEESNEFKKPNIRLIRRTTRVSRSQWHTAGSKSDTLTIPKQVGRRGRRVAKLRASPVERGGGGDNNLNYSDEEDEQEGQEEQVDPNVWTEKVCDLCILITLIVPTLRTYWVESKLRLYAKHSRRYLHLIPCFGTKLLEGFVLLHPPWTRAYRSLDTSVQIHEAAGVQRTGAECLEKFHEVFGRKYLHVMSFLMMCC